MDNRKFVAYFLSKPKHDSMFPTSTYPEGRISDVETLTQAKNLKYQFVIIKDPKISKRLMTERDVYLAEGTDYKKDDINVIPKLVVEDKPKKGKDEVDAEAALVIASKKAKEDQETIDTLNDEIGAEETKLGQMKNAVLEIEKKLGEKNIDAKQKSALVADLKKGKDDIVKTEETIATGKDAVTKLIAGLPKK